LKQSLMNGQRPRGPAEADLQLPTPFESLLVSPLKPDLALVKCVHDL